MSISHLWQSISCSMLLLAALAWASAADPNAQPAGLTAAGQKLEASYAQQLQTLQTEITQALPKVNEQKQAAFQAAREALVKAKAAANAAQQPLANIQTAEALVAHSKGKWLGGAEKGIANAEQMLKKATTDAAREAANKELAKWQADKEAGLKALKERQEALEAAKANQLKAQKAKQAADAALNIAVENELKAAKDILSDVASVLSSDRLDSKLVKCAVLRNATPHGLAEFAQQSQEHETLVDKLLRSETLMKQMLEAGGPKDGRFGPAVKIYSAIRKASSRSQEGIFHRLALGTCLEHAVPINQRNATADVNAPTTVDPVQRYLHYEKAYLQGELDPAFKDMTAWECRLIVRSDAPDHVLAWGREMLRNYRPDHIQNPDYGWRYSGMVRTDVAYRSSHLLKDVDTLEFFQNVCKEGGICGRRAFFGRFILHSFGIPSVERPQRGHAALAHWTPKGWVINLGAGWGYHEAKGVLGMTDTDFLLETQIRERPQQHESCLRAEWVGDALGEKKYESMKGGTGGFWNILAQFQKKVLVAEAKPVALAALGQELGEANESADTKAQAVAKAVVNPADQKIVIQPNGVITIPAAVWSGASLMNSFQGGQQLFSGGGTFHCNIDVPTAGKYKLTARVVTVHDNPNLLLAVNDAKAHLEIVVPYTMGLWDQTAPIQVELKSGKNSLRITRPADSHGLSMKDFTLTPVK